MPTLFILDLWYILINIEVDGKEFGFNLKIMIYKQINKLIKKIFEEGKFDVGYKDLRGIERRILPFWKKYLRGELGKNIFELERFLIKKL